MSSSEIAEQAADVRLDLPVLGMTCAACVRRVDRGLRKLSGVHEVNVNLVTNTATVQYDQSQTNADALARAIREAGYEVPALDVVDAGETPFDAQKTAEERARVIDDAEVREQKEMRLRFVVALVLTLPLFVLAMSHGLIPFADEPLGRLVQLALATPIVFGPGGRFMRLALVALKHRSSDMNTLVSLGVLSAYLFSAAATLFPGWFASSSHGHAPHVYFEAAAAIITFVLLGKLLETRARRRLSEAVKKLVSLVPKTAHRVTATGSEDVEVQSLRRGDHVLVRPGERLPIDGVIMEGSAAIDESMLTGESLPIDKTEGSPVFGGTLNQAGAFTMMVTRVGRDTALARIVEAVEQAQGSRAPIARLADTVSAVFVPIVISLALLTALVWFLFDPTDHGLSMAIEHMVSVLVIACPCALGLATPAAVAVGTGRGADLGVLFKGGAALEALSQVDTILLDKTGTLTSGKPELTDVIAVPGFDADVLLAQVAATESASEHPVGRAIVEGARARKVAVPSARGFAMEVGGGALALVDGHQVRVGTAEFLKKSGVDSSPLHEQAHALAERGRTPSYVAVDGHLAGLIAVADRPTRDAQSAIERLRHAGVTLTMLSGDLEGTAKAIGRELGITNVIAGVKPTEKADVVRAEQAGGRKVAMVGDGINDAPALAAAHVGIAIGSGADIAVATADVALLRGGIRSLPTALELARATLHTIRQNLFWAFVYNVIGIPIAAGILHPFTGFSLSPVIASAAMSLSSVSVLTNSLRLKRFGR